jgi:hypothetical protein
VTPPPHMVALERANEVRLARSGVKYALRDGRMSIEEALEHPAIQTMPIGPLLCCQRRWGVARSARVLHALRWCSPPVLVSEARLVRDLTVRERAAIVRVCKEGM